ncbi:MAG TPA: RNA polymerase sigma factor [Kofleriaceae bacterium]|nr:RNA polymerase sigma factor [Kofleriaceae bacterium]
MSGVPSEIGHARERFLDLVGELRPALHRYCARLVGSAVDGEDVVQDALAKAFYAIALESEPPTLKPWLFRIAHNTAIDFLRRYEHSRVERRDDLDETTAAEPEPAVDPAAVRASLASFLELPVRQRSAVILKDVLDQSLAEAAEAMGTTIPAVKAALVRGRAALRAQVPAVRPTASIDPDERARLERYAALFNARDWDALRSLLSEECRLDLVSKAARRGPGVRGYLDRYAAETGVRAAVGVVEGRPALLVFTATSGGRPAYFIFIDWSGDRVDHIRDYRYAAHVAADAEIEQLSAGDAPATT